MNDLPTHAEISASVNRRIAAIKATYRTEDRQARIDEVFADAQRQHDELAHALRERRQRKTR